MAIPAERHKAISDYLNENEFADIEMLSAHVKASPATIRRDLKELEKIGAIVRTRGGAARAHFNSMGHEPSYSARARHQQTEKRAIALQARDLIFEGQVIALDVGSTCYELAKSLRGYHNITVFTASLPIAQLLAASDVSVFVVGGKVRPKELSVIGPTVAQLIAQYHFDWFFMGAAGVTPQDGFTDFSVDDVEVKKILIKQSRQVVALLDHTKIGQVAFAQICPLLNVTQLITDQRANPTDITEMEQLGLEVCLAPVAT